MLDRNELELMLIANDIGESGIVESKKQEYEQGAFDIEFVNKILSDRDMWKSRYELARKLSNQQRESIKRLDKEVNRLWRKQHVYKCELGKCQRKLRRVYDYIYKTVAGQKTEFWAKIAVDFIKKNV